MRYLLLSAFVLGLALPASADSWCQYEQGLIGTNAIGYVFPYSLTTDRVDHEQRVCEIDVRREPDDNAEIERHSCGDFQHMSKTFEPKTPGVEPTGFEPYFGLLVFKNTGRWLALRKEGGEDFWVEPSSLGVAFHNRSGAITAQSAPGLKGISLHERIYSAPDLASGTALPDTGSTEHEAFLSSAMVELGFPADSYKAILADRYSSGYITFRYHVTALIKADNGSEWFEVDEHLIVDSTYIDAHNFSDLFEGRENLQSAGFFTGDALRRVYLPFRDASGVVQSVLTLGPGCD